MLQINHSLSNQNNSIMTNGANALKFEEEAKTETESHEASTTNTSEEVVSSAIVEEEINSAEDGVSNVSEQLIETQETESSPSNGLENLILMKKHLNYLIQMEKLKIKL